MEEPPQAGGKEDKGKDGGSIYPCFKMFLLQQRWKCGIIESYTKEG